MYLVAPGTDVEAVLPPLPEPAEGSGSGWSPPQAAPSASSSVPPAPTATTAPIAAAAPTCTVDCPPDKPKIVEAPGVHAPHAEQVHAAPRVVIGSGKR